VPPSLTPQARRFVQREEAVLAVRTVRLALAVSRLAGEEARSSVSGITSGGSREGDLGSAERRPAKAWVVPLQLSVPPCHVQRVSAIRRWMASGARCCRRRVGRGRAFDSIAGIYGRGRSRRQSAGCLASCVSIVPRALIHGIVRVEHGCNSCAPESPGAKRAPLDGVGR
jgi:hypothetical protein